MGNTIVTFCDKCYEYGVSKDPLERDLAIGGSDSAWLADMLAGYLLELAERHFEMITFFTCTGTMEMLCLKETDQ